MKNIRKLHILFICLFLFLGWSISPAFGVSPERASGSPLDTAPVISEIIVKIIDQRGDGGKLAEMARNLIFLQEGDPFSTDRLTSSIDALRLSGKFREIDVDSKEGEEMVIMFTLKPSRLIRDIRFEGVYPLFEREVLNVMSIYPGDVFIPDEVPRQRELIEGLYKREGYRAPMVTITTTEDSDDGNFIIHVHIKKGQFSQLEKLDITGNKAFSRLALTLKMKVWHVSFLPGSASRFIENDLKNDIKNLVQLYRSRGFFDAEVNYSVMQDSQSRDVSVIVTIAEGPRYEIEFSGNEAFWDFTLKKDLVFFAEGNIHNRGLRKSLKKIQERYINTGYLKATVKAEEEERVHKGAPVRVIRFVIDEGPRSIVKSLSIEGVRSIEEKKVGDQMLTRVSGLWNKGTYVPQVLQDDLLAIKALYLKEGFMEAAIREDVQLSSAGRDVAIHLTIDEGIRTMVSSVSILGITTISENEALEAISLKVGEPLRKYMKGPDENTLSGLIAEKGYPHVTVKGDVSIGQDRSKALVTYDVDEGPSVKMGNIYTTGNFRTKEKILRNEIELEPGEPFSLARMLEGQRNIRDMDIFQSVQFKTIGLKEKEERVNLFVEVEEKKPYYIQTEGGYDSARGFFAHAKGGDHNLFGTNKDAWVGGDVSQIGYRADMGIKEPRFLGSRISATLSLFTERKQEFNQDFGTQVYGSSLVLNRIWFDRLTTGLGFRYERREQFLRDGSEGSLSSADESEFAPRSILVTTPSISYDGRDSFIRPRKGLFSSFSVDVSTGLRNSIDNFLRYRLDSRYFFTPLNRLTLAFLGRGGFLQAYGDGANIPDDQRFFLGGTNDVRGFAENMLRFDDEGESLGGRVALSGSMEARIDLGYNFELALFYDTGTVEDTFGDVHFNTLRSSAGAGLRYITPIGPVGLLYGAKLDRKPGEDSGRLHFSIGYTF